MISILTSQSAESEERTQPDSKSKEWLSLLQTYLESGDSYFEVTPVHDMGVIREEEGDEEQEQARGPQQQQEEQQVAEVNMLHLGPDDWANTVEIEELRQEALEQLHTPDQEQDQDQDTAPDSSTGDKGGGGGDMDMDMDMDMDEDVAAPALGSDVLAKGTPFSCHDRVKPINAELSRRTRSIKAKLHTLLKALQAKLDTPAPASSSLCSSPVTQSMAQTRRLRAEKLLLTELLAKYKTEIINLQAEVKVGERRLLLVERAKHFAPASSSASAEDGTAAIGTASDSKPNGTAGAATGGVTAASDSSGQSSASPPGLVVGTTDAHGGSVASESGEKSVGSSEHLASTSTGADVATTTANDVLKQQHEVELQAAHDRQAEVELLASVLKEQLADTEGKRSAAEQALAVYIHQTVASPSPSPSSSSEEALSNLSASQRADMEQRWSREAQELEKARQLLQDVRQQHHKKLSEVEMEKNHYFRRMSELELAMSVLTEASASRVADMTEQMTTQMESTRQEKEKAVASLHTIQQELQMFELTKARLVEAETVEASTKRQCTELSERIKSQNKTAEITDQNLALSRERENELTTQLAAAAMRKEQNVRHAAYAAGLQQLQDEAEEGMIPEESSIDISKDESVQKAQQACHTALTSLLAHTQARVSEVSAELVDAKENMNDLILEIESVANEEERTREHNARLVKQLGETQGTQKEMRMENLRLHQEIHEMHETSVELKQEKARLTAHIKQQNAIIDTLKAAAHKVRVEMHQLNNSLVTTSSAAESRTREREEADSKCAHAESVTADCRRKISDLKTRCSELSKQHDAERKQRLGVERQLAATQAKNARLRQKQGSSGSGSDGGGAVSNSSTSSGGGSGSTAAGGEGVGEGEEKGSQQQQMLDMTLNMLRCSVCHDRFKEVAITRCFHLFCKPCIDLNLSSRHRKCPACGERFGQDDVKSVFFTH